MEEFINRLREYKKKNGEPKKVLLSPGYYKELINEYPTTNTAEMTTICGIPFEVVEDLKIGYQFEA